MSDDKKPRVAYLHKSENIYYTQDEFGFSEGNRTIENAYIKFVDADYATSLERKLERAKDALGRKCCCPGEARWSDGTEILCEPCEALKEIEEVE